MEKTYKFAVDDIHQIVLENYDDDEFAIARMGFLSTRPNAHHLEISEDVLRDSAPSVLGKWLIADMTGIFDAGTHTDKEKIVGRIPENQEVVFAEEDGGYLRAYVDVVISKIYAKDFCKIFTEEDNTRSVSVEMRVVSDKEDENKVESFRIAGVTVLGKSVAPSCAKSDIVITRFSEEEVDKFFSKVHKDSLTELQKFVNERKILMAETYKIDKSKEAMSDRPWGDVDKTALRNKIMEASNRATLVKSVYMLVEDGWEDAPSECLKYPIMEFKGDTLVYNRGALASALGYAKKENETTVVNKIEKIYKKLELDDSDGKEDDAKMSKEVEFSAVDLDNLWHKLYNEIKRHDGWCYCIYGIYEQDNQKFAVLTDDDGCMFRLNFSLTEEGLTVDENITEVKIDFIDTDKVYKFAGPEELAQFSDPEKVECSEDECEADDKGITCGENEDCEMSCEEMKAEIARLQGEIESRDNIIMEKDNILTAKDTELSELREFKAGVEKEKVAMTVEQVMAEVEGTMDKTKMKEFREEGLNCEMSALSAWTNKVKAYSFDSAKSHGSKKTNDVWSFAAPATQKKTGSVWDEI